MLLFVDVIRVAVRTREDDAHNVQAVIDSLSMDVLSISLSHITGQDVIYRIVFERVARSD